MKSLDTRLYGRCAQSGECWIWRGPTHDGYGQIRYQGRSVRAHRASYLYLRGDIPTGLTLDHLCRNRACVNPDHLEPVPIGVNALRGVGVHAINARKVACDSGHSLADPYVRPSGGRDCRVCRRERSRRYQARKREGSFNG